VLCGLFQLSQNHRLQTQNKRKLEKFEQIIYFTKNQKRSSETILRLKFDKIFLSIYQNHFVKAKGGFTEIRLFFPIYVKLKKNKRTVAYHVKQFFSSFSNFPCLVFMFVTH